MNLAILVLPLLAVLHGAPPRTIDYRQCQSPSDYGWPRFESEEALVASPWKAYLNETYGGLPTEYPFCTFDLWYINSNATSYKGLMLKVDPSKSPGSYKVNHTFHKVTGCVEIHDI